MPREIPTEIIEFPVSQKYFLLIFQTTAAINDLFASLYFFAR